MALLPRQRPQDLRGRPLRYLLVTVLADAGGERSVKYLIQACAREGVVFDGRASKIISDALRWEIRNGRVKRVTRGVYAIDRVPRSTMYWIRQRTAQTRHWFRWVTRLMLGDDDEELNRTLGLWQRRSWVPPWPLWPDHP